MQSEERMKTAMFIPVLLVIVVAAASPGKAQQAGTGEQVKPPVAKDAADATSATVDQKERAEPASRFNPSEKIRADDALSFPVDI